MGGRNVKKILLVLMGIVFLMGCSNQAASISVNDIVEQFKTDGLEIGEISDLDNSEFGESREEGKRILIPSLGDDKGGRLFVFKDEEGLNAAKSYYDDLGKGSPLLYSHTYANGLVLLQMNGDMSDEDFAKYTESIESVME